MIIDKFRSTVKHYNLISKNDTIVVGVSGGPDSVTLLSLLCALSGELSLKIHVAHLDHGWRKGSQGDCEFVQNLARKLSLPVIVKRIGPGQIPGHISREEAWRNARQEFLCLVAKAAGANSIALGHNLDDQAETVLMRIVRGTGLYGLSAILPARKIKGFTFIRPLIEVTRDEIETYLKKKRIAFCLDPSNRDEVFFRNKLRNKLIPVLEKKYNPNIKASLSNLAQSSASDYDYLYSQALRVMPRSFTVKLKKLSRLHQAIQRLVIRLMIQRRKGDTRRITYQHIKEIESLIAVRPASSIVDLPQNISVKKTNDSLVFYKRL